MFRICLLNLFLFFSFIMYAQEDDGFDFGLDEEEVSKVVLGTFKSSRVINGQSVSPVPKGLIDFRMQHRFGKISDGSKEFFGLDNGTTRFSFEYGILDQLSLGVARSSSKKIYEGFVKSAVIRQTKGGIKQMPVSVILYANMALKTIDFYNPKKREQEDFFINQLNYTYQVLVGRKFSSNFSFQIAPTLIHKNFAQNRIDQHNVYSIGFGSKLNLSKRIVLNTEYYWLLPGQTADDYYNSFAVSVDIETGGHTFQIMIANSQKMTESEFITNTEGDWLKGELNLGFNISRVFKTMKTN